MDINTPLSQLRDEDDIVKAVAWHYEQALEAAKERISTRNRNALIFEGHHYQSYNPLSGVWQAVRSVNKEDAWRPRTQTMDMYNNVTTLVPILNRSQPRTIVEAEYPDEIVDTREMDDAGELFGMMSGIKGSQAATILTDLLEVLSDRRMDTLLYANIVIEAILGGQAFVDFKIKTGWSGTRVIPNLLMQEQLLVDPSATRYWDLEDAYYIVKTEMMTSKAIKAKYGIDESEYAGISHNESLLTSTLNKMRNRFKSQSNTDTNTKLPYGMQPYPVRTLYALEDIPGEDFENISNQPPMMMYRTVNDRKLVSKRESPFWHKRYPVTVFMLSPSPHKAGGISEVSQMFHSQMTTNLIQNIILENAINSGYDRVIAEEGVFKKGKLSSAPNSICLLYTSPSPRDS